MEEVRIEIQKFTTEEEEEILIGGGGILIQG